MPKPQDQLPGKAPLERSRNFERLKAQLEGEGYQSTPRTFSILKANLYGLLPFLPYSYGFTLVHGDVERDLSALVNGGRLPY
ncbi:MAG: hypothetical protein LBD02_07735 [Christensenellaceae bacterium]|jgi:hypothetical protein|nr:hypothetical protein [Christensenellaceae bacterium]